MKTFSKYPMIGVVLILLIAMVTMVGCNTCTICGVYLLQGNPNAYLEFLSDGTFNAAGFWGSNVTGHWYADGDKITVTSQWGSGAGTMNGNNFIDNDGRIWIKSGK